MEGFFLQVLDRSVTVCWLILAVVCVRLMLKKAPKWIRGILWGMVALRLVLPFSLESVFSLLPEETPVEYVRMEEVRQSAASVIQELNPGNELMVVTPTGGADAGVVQKDAIVTGGVNILSIVTILWLAGVILMVLYCILSYGKLRRRVAEAVIYRKEKPCIYESEKVDSPFVLGLIKPCIYLPHGMNEEDRQCVIAHEEAHISRGDHFIKPIGFLILAVYWFHPLVWLAYILLCRDIELACDEKVIASMTGADKKVYTKALLECSKPQRMISACPLAFGEVGVKKRIMNVLNYKKPAFWIILLSILACVIVGVCFLTDPKDKTETDLETESVDSQSQQVSMIPLEEKNPEAASTENENRDVEKSTNVLTTPPTMYLQNVLSGYWNEFPVDSNTYGWSHLTDEGQVLCVDAAAKHGISGEVKGKEWLQVHVYSRHDAWYSATFEVNPDSMSIREYDLLDLGDMNPELLSEADADLGLLELKPRRIYEVTANWSEDGFEERGFSGTATYVFATDNYAISGTELQGEKQPVLIEAYIKDAMVDTKDRICIHSETEGFPGAFMVIVPESVYDKRKLERNAGRLIIAMKDTGEMQSNMHVYEATYLQQIDKNSEGSNLPSVRERWTEEVNTFDGAELLFEKYTNISGDLEFVNQSDRDLQYGEWFDIQRRVNGEWYSLSYVIEDLAFHQVAYLLPKGETSVNNVNWVWMYGELPPGNYRIVTEVMDYRAPGDFDKYYLAEEFEIK
ncbi:MAG: M56 family metallopeptidase [Lachnospiraceae bacterium]|nr:M56 family metallopeptidase [Lachnospiraceae bacterium]